MAIPDLLRGCPLFFELYDKEVERIVHMCDVFEVPTGEAIIRDGEIGNDIFVVLEGAAVAQKSTPKGIITVNILKQGDVFGEMVLVDEKIRSATIMATANCSILRVKYKDIFVLFQKEPKIFGIVILNLSRLLAKRLRNANKTIVTLQEDIDKRRAA
jgi:CRP/FNR family cyclic AMP-dependent transcriptional regulator